MLSNLGQAYQGRFKHLYEIRDIDKAIGYLERAVLLAPEGHASKLMSLNGLGSAYLARFEDHYERPDIDKAIEYLSAAALAIPDGHVRKSALLNNLGISYHRRFTYCGVHTDIDKAIEYQSQAVRLTSDRHIFKAGQLTNLGRSYSGRFSRLGELSDAKKAIECHKQAILLAPDGHAGRPGLLSNAADAYLSLVRSENDHEYAEFARSFFQQAAQLGVTNPLVQLRCAREWAGLSISLGLSPEPAYRRAMELVPRVIWLGTTIAQRYRTLTFIGNAALEAAAWAISAQSFELALQWLEEGRSIVWNQMLQLRTPFDELFAADSVLAGRLQDIARQLKHGGSPPVTIGSSTSTEFHVEQDAQYHHRLANEWDQLLERARELPGFSNFMRPRAANELRLAAKDGPVVLINIHRSRCDALIVQPDTYNIGHVHLENFSLEEAGKIRTGLQSLIGQRGRRAGGFKRSLPVPEDSFRYMLATLWRGVVKPILGFLGYTRKLPVEELPHVTWCTTGALSFLPLHAAGLYDGSQPNTFDLIASSYTPTLGALLTSSSPASSHSGLLAVSQEHSKGLGDLPNTVQELAAIKLHTRGIPSQQLDGENATVGTVLDAMGQHGWVHFACHATQDPENPAHSAFHLHDGNLTLETITQRSFKNKGLAFLSACQTATGDEKRPDEAIHLAAGMLMAGYPSVIATMWSILDEDAPEVARKVYAELLKDGKMDCTQSAIALHKAVSGLREKVGQTSFQRWAPFIHMGL